MRGSRTGTDRCDDHVELFEIDLSSIPVEQMPRNLQKADHDHHEALPPVERLASDWTGVQRRPRARARMWARANQATSLNPGWKDHQSG